MSDNENTPDNSSLDRTKDKVIVGNNAHTIYEHSNPWIMCPNIDKGGYGNYAKRAGC